MAAALVAARLPRPQREFVDVVGRETMEFGSSGVRLRPVSSLLVYRLKGIISESRFARFFLDLVLFLLFFSG